MYWIKYRPPFFLTFHSCSFFMERAEKDKHARHNAVFMPWPSTAPTYQGIR